ncbi:hypothetical protein A6A08_24810 [Nocardiopsis sp. TSRI0078]|nr:hypothetical protein A6A08_24810 [Nocardiopsis sp. TSRI0078]
MGDRVPPFGRQSSDLADGTADGGAVHTERQAQNRVRQVVAHMDQGGHPTVGEDQAVPGARPGSPLPLATPDPVPATLDHRFPGAGQLLDERGQVVLGDAGEPGMGRDRTIDLDRHDQRMPRPSGEASPAVTHQLVTRPRVWT